MSNRDPEETADLILRALSLAGQRAVILSGWGGFRQTDLPDTVMVMKSAPHDWLFARAAAVVHHGGAGTTAASLRSGVPTAVVPFFGDQPFWGRRVADLGVGPEPMSRRRLTAEQLARAIKEMVYNQTMRQRAASLGAAIRAENGVAQAAALLQKWLD
jgi:UDP:flavonoid glycosyltransferase YjiC (YdhE family)